MMAFTTGLRGTASTTVTPEKTAAACGSGSLPVFGTPFLLALMEEATCNAVFGALEDGQSTVGVSMELQHSAPSPVGMEVRAEACLTEVNGKCSPFPSPLMTKQEKSAAEPSAAASFEASRFWHVARVSSNNVFAPVGEASGGGKCILGGIRNYSIARMFFLGNASTVVFGTEI